MIDRRLTMRLGGPPLHQWWGATGIPVFVGLIITLASPTWPAFLTGLTVLAVGIAASARIYSVATVEELGSLKVRNPFRTRTVPLDRIAAVRSAQILTLRTLRSYGRLVITDVDGHRLPLVATTGESPEIVRIFVRDLLAAVPDSEVDVDLAWFPHDRARTRGTDRLGPPREVPVPPKRVDPAEERRRRVADGRADLDRLRRELDQIQRRKE